MQLSSTQMIFVTGNQSSVTYEITFTYYEKGLTYINASENLYFCDCVHSLNFTNILRDRLPHLFDIHSFAMI